MFYKNGVAVVGDMFKATYDANENDRIEKDAIGITLNKLLKGAGIGVIPDEIDVPAGGGMAIYGDGYDGDLTVNADPFTSGALIVNNALQRDAFFQHLTINATRKIETNGYRIVAQGTLTNNGTIERNGNDGETGKDSASAAGGSALVAGSLGASGAGGAGNELAGSDGDNVDPALGGKGGAGGASGGNAGGARGTVTEPTSKSRASPFAILLEDGGAKVKGGAGGGGGGGAGTGGSGGGGGGGGAGVLCIIAKTIVNTSGVIEANGGNGGDGTDAGAGDGGGGGGGGGGLVVLVYNTLTTGWVEQALGGDKGIGAGGAIDGNNGLGGTVIRISNV